MTNLAMPPVTRWSTSNKVIEILRNWSTDLASSWGVVSSFRKMTTILDAFCMKSWKPASEDKIMFVVFSSSKLSGFNMTFFFIEKIKDLIVLLCVWGLLAARPTRIIVKSWFTALNLHLMISQMSVKIYYASDLIFRFEFVIELISSMM